MIWEQIAEGVVYVIVVLVLLLGFLPRLIDALTREGDYPDYGKGHSDWFIGADIPIDVDRMAEDDNE